MAYSAANLTRIGGASNGDLWFYSSADAIGTVNTAGRDVIIAVDTNTPTTNFVNVLSNTGSVVDVSDGTAIAETDGD